MILALGGHVLPVAAQSGAVVEGVVTAEALNVRRGPSTRYLPMGLVYRGERVRILDESGGWYRIAADGLMGWSSGVYIQPIEPRQRQRDPRREPEGYREPPRERYRPDFAFIRPSRFGYVNVFDGPGRDYRLIGQLDEGQRVQVLESGRRWTLIAKRGFGRGYVRSEILID
ncbi:MAG: SH3 domain-containing protein [Candidatus Competibacterales bacterium]